MLSEDDLEHVELDSPLNVDVLGLSSPECLWAERVVLYLALLVLHTGEERVLVHMKGERAVDNVGEVEVHNVVASDDVRVDLQEKVSPGLQHLLLTDEGVDLRADDRGTGAQCEHVSNQGLWLTVNFNYICYLYDGISLRLRELSLVGWAFYVKTKDA